MGTRSVPARIFIALIIFLFEVCHVHGYDALRGIQFSDNILHEYGFSAHVADQAESVDVFVAPAVDDQTRAPLAPESQVEKLCIDNPDNQ